MTTLITDVTWIRQSFLVGVDKNNNPYLDATSLANRTYSTASNKFTDTRPGGSIPINPPPQFTRHADLRVSGVLQNGTGLGRYYSEAIDDHSQIIHMRFGVPQFNSLTTFFAGFYSGSAAQLARTGRSDKLLFQIGRAAGFVVGIMSWKLLAIGLIGAGVRFFLRKPSSRFYFLKPAMTSYWQAVQTIVNHMAVNRGIVPRLGGSDQSALSDEYQFDAAGIATLHKLIPDIFTEGGSIDVWALANRARRLYDKRQQLLLAMEKNATSTDIVTRIQQINAQQLTDKRPVFTTGDSNKPGYLEKWLATSYSKPKGTSSNAGTNSTTTDSGSSAADSTVEDFNTTDFSDNSLTDFFKAELEDGSAFVSFRVNPTGHVSESFSNSVADSELKNKVNSMSSQSRSTNFDLAGGDLIGGSIGAVIGTIIGAVKDVASGVASGLGISGLAVAGGAAFVDIPKHWESSSATMNRSSYTINLVSPYGNPISQLLNLDIPFAMLLAAVLPLSTGRQSYTSPFLVELYDQGRQQTRLGIVDSLSVSRGTTNLGFNRDGHALGMEVTFSVLDLSDVLHLPISESISLIGAAAQAAVGAAVSTGASLATNKQNADKIGGAAGAFAGQVVDGAAFDDETQFSDYMAVLAGMSVHEQIYPFRRLKLSLTQRETDFKSFVSRDHFASWAGDTWVARLYSAKFGGVTF